MSTRNKEVIKAAIEGLEARKRHINEQIAELKGMLSGASAELISVSPANGRRTISATARKRIADAKGAASGAVASAPKKAKGRLSPEGGGTLSRRPRSAGRQLVRQRNLGSSLSPRYRNK